MRDADSFMVRKIGVSNRRGSGAAGISIVETVLNGDADQIGGAPRRQLVRWDETHGPESPTEGRPSPP
jgi:hypothetical protein